MNEINLPTCEREDLRVIINAPTYWSVADDGSMGDEDFGEGGFDNNNFDSYYCNMCGEFFLQAEKRDDAWLAALAHIAVSAGAVTGVGGLA